MKKVFIDNLPKKKYGDKYHFEWSKIAKTETEIKFIYEDVSGIVRIVDYDKKNTKSYT